MEVNKSQIIKKTKELTELINKHEITTNYKNLYNKLLQDKHSRDLLSRLVIIGQETTERINSGQEISREPSWENTSLEKELENNLLVKNFILAQKKYLELITNITDHIKNPQ